MSTPVAQRSSPGIFATIRSRMLFWVLAVTLPIYAGALYLSYQATAQRLETDAARDADELAARLAAEIDMVIRPIEGGIRTVAAQLEAVSPPRDQYAPRIQGILATWPDVYGSTIAVEVHDGDPASQPFAPYYFRRDDAIAYADLASESYGYRKLPWYRGAADAQRPVWSSPYFDAGGGETWMVTYSVPFYRTQAGQRALAGVITADLDLKWVQAAAGHLTLGSFDVGWLASPPAERAYIAPIGATAGRVASRAATPRVEVIRTAAEQMLSQGVNFGLLRDGVTSEPAYLAVRNLETVGWRVMLVIPRAHLLADARHLLRSQLWLGAAGLLVLIAAVSFVAAGISRPIHRLAELVGSAEEGNLDFPLPDDARRDETGVLTQALRRLRDSLKSHVQLRAQALAAQTRLEHELQIAANIQQSMLPRREASNLPAIAQVAGVLLPARQVGGDFYDYFGLRDGNVLFVIGDVSDKGIPAALFMARLSGLIRVLGNNGDAPHLLLAALNSRLAEANDACMFATIGCGILGVRTGRLQYASAGHESPLVRRVDGSVISLPAENGPAIGIDAGVEYLLTETFLAPGDSLVLFTDGVTEAEALDGRQFGAQRLGVLLQDAGSADPEALVRRIVDQVGANSPDFHATDDLTVLALSLAPQTVSASADAQGEHWRIAPPPTADGTRQALQWLRAIFLARDIEPERVADAELIAEELLTNIARVAESRGRGNISVECSLISGDITLTFRDDGPPFDPLAREAPQLDAEIGERSVGGLGIHLVRKLADVTRYHYRDGLNILEIRLRSMPAQHGDPT